MTSQDHHESQNLSHDELEFLIGSPEQFRREDATVVPRSFKRAIADSGLDDKLALLGISSHDLPDDALKVITATPTSIKGVGLGADLAHELANMFRDAYTIDRQFEQRDNRWRKTPDRVSGYVSTDAGSLRLAMAHRGMAPTSSLSPAALDNRTNDALATAYAYMGDPHFIPAKIAAEIVTATPPAPSKRPEIRLPGRYAWMFHDGVPLTDIVGDDIPPDQRLLLTSDTLLIGALLAGNGDLSLYDLAFLLVAARGSGGRYFWAPLPLPMGTGAPATNIVWNYAALLSWEDWKSPPRLPQRHRGESNRAYRRRLQRTPEASQGALHKVRVLDYQPPPVSARPRKPTQETGKELEFQQDRRGHWKHGIRFGIRDENDKLVGPVYKDGAVEGVTFTRRTKFIRPTTVREDLPRKPGTTVYRLPSTVQRQDGGRQ
ncbi:hypothetical protein [Spirillospora sp. CA-128828]|uniref:hypothetical protein n=1 Tax=Spirillospora sp. CA-128828 TaxID=3240033 RepID=UPI003D904B53